MGRGKEKKLHLTCNWYNLLTDCREDNFFKKIVYALPIILKEIVINSL